MEALRQLVKDECLQNWKQKHLIKEQKYILDHKGHAALQACRKKKTPIFEDKRFLKAKIKPDQIAKSKLPKKFKSDTQKSN